VLASLATAFPAGAVTLPPNFTGEVVVQNLNTPTCIAFLPDGRLLIGEKAGRVRIAKNGVLDPDPFWTRESEVLNSVDMGLMSVAVDPNFATNRYVYLFYVVDPDTNGVDDNLQAFGRLTRYQVSLADTNMVDYSTRTILLGVDWSRGPLVGAQSHTTGALRWGEDGSLLLSLGDGASGGGVDAGGLYPAAFGPGKTNPNEDIGAFRAQDFTSLCGKVLRINPANGLGYPSNPYATVDLSAPQSKVWVYGFRNPFRFAVRPGTGQSNPTVGDPGTLVIGDVGWLTWEEINIAPTSNRNFGWPCEEGPNPHAGYSAANPAHHNCTTIGLPQNPGTLSDPTLAWHHSNPALSVPQGLLGNCSIMGAFYTGTRYPPAFQGRLFFSDFGQNWLKTALLDANDSLVDIADFGSGLANPVDWAADPNGDLHYVAIGQGQVWRLRYSGPSAGDPVAAAGANTLQGYLPLNVTFSSAASYSPGGNPLTFSWDLGDGTGSTAASPQRTYTKKGVFQVILTVEDDLGRLDRDTLNVVALATPPFPTTPVLDNFNRPSGAIGGDWVHEISNLLISNRRLRQSGGQSNAVYDGAVYGPDQEAYLTLSQIDSNAPHQDLMLKIQGTADENGHIQVRYDVNYPRITVATFSQVEGWVTRGIANLSQPLAEGTVLGARASSDGYVSVYVNSAEVGRYPYHSWIFATDGGRIGISLNDASGGRYDDFGGGNTASGFPAAPVVDNFNRPNGTIGLPWLGETPGLSINANQLEVSGSYSAPVWFGSNYGPNQEAYIKLVSASFPTSNYSLMMKVQGEALASGNLLIKYDVTGKFISCASYTPGPGWTEHGIFFMSQALAPNDVLGARAYSSGVVEIFVNGQKIAGFDYSSWPFAIYGGRIGLAMVNASGARLDDFGAADILVDTNQPPIATILAPSDTTFYVEGDTLQLVGSSSDDTDTPVQLGISWKVDLHHNTHVHPAIFSSTDSITTMVTEAHDDGTGTFLRASFRVVDTYSKADTAIVDLFPEVDLRPYLRGSPVSVTSTDSLHFDVVLRNYGRMLAPYSRWMLLRDGVAVVQGDTLVSEDDSVSIHVNLPPAAVGNHTFRLVADTLAKVVETNEFNNADMVVIAVVPNQPPHAIITSPADSSSYVAGIAVTLYGSATDDGSTPVQLTRQWTVALHRAGKPDSTVWTSGDSTTTFVPAAYSGTGIFLRARWRVSEPTGQADTATVDLFREVDFQPLSVLWSPTSPSSADTVLFFLLIQNNGRMPASAPWTIRFDGQTLASGEKSLNGLTNTMVTWKQPPPMPPGNHTVRLVLDSLGTVVETQESNNALTVPMYLSLGPDIFPPSFVEGPANDAWGTHAFLRFITNEPTRSWVLYGTTYALGETVVGDSIVVKHDLMLTGLSPSTTYYFEVQIADSVGNVNLSPLDSLSTGAWPLGGETEKPGRITLSTAYPNPARSSVSFALALPEPAEVDFAIYDLQGRLVFEERGDRGAGRHTLTWRGATLDGAAARAGLYLAFVRVGGAHFTRRLVLVR